MRRFAALIVVLLTTPASADTLFDNVKGVTATSFGQVLHFSALLVGDDGKIIRTYGDGEKLPDRVKYRVDGHGKPLTPAFIDTKEHVIEIGLAALAQELGVINAPAAPGPRDRDAALAKAQSLLLAQGITTVADMGTSVEDWLAFRRAGDEGRLRIRIVSYAKSIDAMIAVGGGKPTPWLYNDRLRMSGVYLDGSIKPQKSAILMRNEESRQRNQMSRVAMDGFQLAVETKNVADQARITSDFDDLLKTYTGERRWRNLYTENNPSHVPSDVVMQDDAALKSADANARLLMAENQVGRLSIGQHADFVMYAAGAVALSAPLETYIDGQLVYKKP